MIRVDAGARVGRRGLINASITSLFAVLSDEGDLPTTSEIRFRNDAHRATQNYAHRYYVG